MGEESLLRICRIEALGLFNLYQHKVPLNLDQRVTIIHGPNGVGKTVLLRLLASLCSGRLTEFARIPFGKFLVTLSDGSELSVVPGRTNGSIKPGGQDICVSVKDRDGVREIKLPSPLADSAIEAQLELPGLERAEPVRWTDIYPHPMLSPSREVWWTYGGIVPPSIRFQPSFEGPEWFAAKRKQVRVHLIEAQRLIRVATTPPQHYGLREETQLISAVRGNAQDLQVRITEALKQLSIESQALDQTIPERLLKEPARKLSIDELKERMKSIQERQKRLQAIGLLDEGSASPFDVASLDQLQEAKRNIMALYVEDSEKKLGVLAGLAGRIELLVGNLNEKFQHKVIRVDRERGFVASTGNGQPLELDALSSGEQHELVLLYDLLFRVQPNTLVLIDEPELSLHVEWQKRFLADLLQIVKAADIDALVATHSPFIVGDRSDLMVPLETEVS